MYTLNTEIDRNLAGNMLSFYDNHLWPGNEFASRIPFDFEGSNQNWSTLHLVL